MPTAPSVDPSPAARRVLICDELAPEALEVFAQRGLEAERAVGLPEDELRARVKDAAALVVRSATKVTRRLIEAAPRLEVVGRAGVGVDNVDLDAATDHGVVVMNAPTGNTTTTAELAVALLCALARHIPRADRAVRAGEWRRKKGLTGTELSDKTLGVVGLGRIGRVVAERARGLAMHVVAHDPYLSGQRSPVEGVELVELDELLARSDFISLHVPLTDSTRHLLDERRLGLCKPGARLVNCARGGLVDEGALARALDSGRLRGAALDVLEHEPPPPDHALLGREDVILTPHLGASSDEAQRNVAVDIARQVCDFLLEGVASNAVNAPALSKKTLREIAPYIVLAERLGGFLARRSDAPLRTLEVSLSGDIARADASHVRLALLVGVLRVSSDTPVNFVNAPRLAAERGLSVVDQPEEEQHFLHSRLRVRARSDAGTWLVAGTVYGREPRIVRVDDVTLDLPPAGPLLITTHQDRPGVVGMIGTVLGRHGVNIRRVELGPPAVGAAGVAAGFFTLYDELPPEALGEIAALEPLRSVELVQF
jgi:D-3-phosphoglycerate dehydrogenase